MTESVSHMHGIPQVEGGQECSLFKIYWAQKILNQDICVSVCLFCFVSHLTLASSNLFPFIPNVEKAN